MTGLEQFLLPFHAIECLAVIWILVMGIGILGYVLSGIAMKNETFRLVLGAAVIIFVIIVCILFIVDIYAT